MKNQKIEHFCPEGSDLASRASARNLRTKAEQTIKKGNTAVIDLTNVISISESYADELFAVLVEQHGLEWFSNNVKLLHDKSNSNGVFRSIATAIRRRLESQESHAIKISIDGLIAAKKASNSKKLNHQHA